MGWREVGFDWFMTFALLAGFNMLVHVYGRQSIGGNFVCSGHTHISTLNLFSVVICCLLGVYFSPSPFITNEDDRPALISVRLSLLSLYGFIR